MHIEGDIEMLSLGHVLAEDILEVDDMRLTECCLTAHLVHNSVFILLFASNFDLEDHWQAQILLPFRFSHLTEQVVCLSVLDREHILHAVGLTLVIFRIDHSVWDVSDEGLVIVIGQVIERTAVLKHFIVR